MLKNSVVEPYTGLDDIVHTPCETADAELLLERAKGFCPDAVPYIEESLKTVRDISARAYRRHPASQTWHFCSKCSQWPGVFDFISSVDLPGDYEICNECIVKNQVGECN